MHFSAIYLFYYHSCYVGAVVLYYICREINKDYTIRYTQVKMVVVLDFITPMWQVLKHAMKSVLTEHVIFMRSWAQHAE